jgi:predicted AlkP superfamily pyrophosphatase or phosphodiesterase
MKEGSYAEAVQGVYPTVTYPAHTTIVTGRLPAEHGIYTNLSSREPGKNSGDWFWFASAIKAPTLWDEARRAHLSTASVAWPVTVGAAIDWDIPEIWDPRKRAVADPLYLAKYMSPLLSLEILAALGPPKGGSDTDAERTRLAIYLLQRHKPNLLLVHLESLDDTEHGFGPDSPQAAAALERIDAHIGEVVEAVKRAGLEATTDVFIVSDHGFLPVHRDVAPNVLLEKAGLLSTTYGAITGGKVETVGDGGCFFIYWPAGSDLRSEVDAALKPLREQGLVWAVLDREALKDLGADPGAQLALDAPDGTEYSNRSNGQLVLDGKPRGTHGFLPYRQGLEASFIAWGPGIRPGVDLHSIHMTAIGPTILRAMGINDPKFGDDSPLGDIFK